MPGSGVTIDLHGLIEMRHRVRDIQLFSSTQRRSPLIGLHHSRLRGRGVDFDQVRLYQPGDDVRNIDWRVTARSQEPHTKIFHEERERPVFLLVEQSRQLFFASVNCFKSVLAARLAALFGWSAVAHNDRVGGLVFGSPHDLCIRPRHTKQSLLQYLDGLARANQSLVQDYPFEAERFSLALHRSRDLLRPGSLVLIICDERSLSGAAEQQIGLLARHCELLLMPISDPWDHRLPQTGVQRFEQAGKCIELDTDSKRLQQRYRVLARQRRQQWERLAYRFGLLLLPLSTERDLLEQLQTPQPQSSVALP